MTAQYWEYIKNPWVVCTFKGWILYFQRMNYTSIKKCIGQPPTLFSTSRYVYPKSPVLWIITTMGSHLLSSYHVPSVCSALSVCHCICCLQHPVSQILTSSTCPVSRKQGELEWKHVLSSLVSASHLWSLMLVCPIQRNLLGVYFEWLDYWADTLAYRADLDQGGGMPTGPGRFPHLELWKNRRSVPWLEAIGSLVFIRYLEG